MKLGWEDILDLTSYVIRCQYSQKRCRNTSRVSVVQQLNYLVNIDIKLQLKSYVEPFLVNFSNDLISPSLLVVQC